MDDYENESLPVGEAQVAEAMQTLQRYKAGKAALDKRIVDNELWFRMGHWKNYQNPMMPGKAQPSSGWLFNSIANKHADAMDNYPEPNVLPRSADDEDTARALSSVLPVVLEQADYEQVYSDCWWRKLKTGTGVTGIFGILLHLHMPLQYLIMMAISFGVSFAVTWVIWTPEAEEAKA